MKQNKGERPRAGRFVAPAGAMVLGLAGVIAACGPGGASPTGPGANAPKALEKIAPERHKRLRAHLGLWDDNGSCPEVAPGIIYRKIEGIDRCPVVMGGDDITRQLNDAWGTNVLAALFESDQWPTSFDSIITQAGSKNSTLVRHAVLLGEGGQMPQASEHDLRFVVTWGDNKFEDVQLFFSARPPSSKSGQPAVLEVIAFDKSKTALNFYHYDGANKDSAAKTWIWTGDSNYAHDPRTSGKGCFTCHLDGGLNMKELTVPWNNWNSNFASIDPSLLPPSDPPDPIVAQLLSANELKGAYDFEPIVRGMNTRITNFHITGPTTTSTVIKDDLKWMFPRLFGTSTINLASSDTKASDTGAIQHLPNDFFVFDTAFRDPAGINLSYGPEKLDTTQPGNLNITLARSDYNAFVTKFGVQMVDRNDAGTITYQQPGGTFFPFFVPTPPFEDAAAITSMITQKIISPKFAAAVLMVDLQNPIFSEPRKSLLQYVDKMDGGLYQRDQSDVPRRFMAAVSSVAQGQPACSPNDVSRCTPEQQLVRWWNVPDAEWKTTFQNAINQYLATIKTRIATPQGAEDYLKLMIARGDQFAHNPVVCHLDEFPLLLPTTNLDQDLRRRSLQMNFDGTIGPKDSYSGCAQ